MTKPKPRRIPKKLSTMQQIARQIVRAPITELTAGQRRQVVQADGPAEWSHGIGPTNENAEVVSSPNFKLS